MTLNRLEAFYNHPRYIEALAEVTREALPDDVDHVLMSYHGLPERHLTKADPTGSHCMASESCCEMASPAHGTCYRHHTRVTSRLLAQALELSPDAYSVTYQSRLGRLPWLQPYTDQTLAALPAKGVKKLAVICPAFVADNLETLEEIGISGSESYLGAGGEAMTLVPCLNDHPSWIAAFADIIQERLATRSA